MLNLLLKLIVGVPILVVGLTILAPLVILNIVALFLRHNSAEAVMADLRRLVNDAFDGVKL